MFGRAYEEIGSSDKGLILKSSGKIKIQWGNKLIDLIDNSGNINNNVKKIINTVSSESEIKQDGFYYVNNSLIAKVGNNILELVSGGNSNTYVSFITEQESDKDQKYTALKNIGFIYNNIEDNNVYPNKGIIYIEDSQTLYIVNNGRLNKYYAPLPNPYNKQFIISKPQDEESNGAIVIEGTGEKNCLKFDSLKIFSEGNDTIFESDKNYRFRVSDSESFNIDDAGIKTNQIASFNYSLEQGFYLNEEKLEIGELQTRKKIKIDYIQSMGNFATVFSNPDLSSSDDLITAIAKLNYKISQMQQNNTANSNSTTISEE